MVSGVKKDSGDVIYMRLKKHVCPDCGQKVFVRKIKKTIKAGSKAAKDYDFTVGDITLDGKVKFIWYEFKCTGCGAVHDFFFVPHEYLPELPSDFKIDEIHVNFRGLCPECQ